MATRVVRRKVQIPDTVAEYRKLCNIVRDDASELIRLEQAKLTATELLPDEAENGVIWCHKVMALFAGQTR